MRSIRSVPDVNDDGYEDFVISSNNHKVYWINSQNGNELFSSNDLGNSCREVELLDDLDGNNLVEIVVEAFSNIICLNGTSSTTNKTEIIWKFNSTNGETFQYIEVVNDVNSDEIKDVIIGGEGENIFCISGNSTDNFSESIWNKNISNITGARPLMLKKLEDTNGDGYEEVIVTDYNNTVSSLSSFNGSVNWIYKLPIRRNQGDHAQSWAITTINDIGGDEIDDVLVASDNWNVTCLNGSTGKELWIFQTGGKVRAITTVPDITGDGKHEVVVSSYDDNIYCLNGFSGNKLWNKDTGFYSYFSDVGGNIRWLNDISGDSKPEVVLGVGTTGKVICYSSGDNGTELWDKAVDSRVRALLIVNSLVGTPAQDVLVGTNYYLTLVDG
ncbi:MAG: PQQ-binding-like beta-propeller repeat protein, partial [Promethearchaeota archaeon]